MTSIATQQPPRVGFTIIVSRPVAALRSNGGHGNKYAVNAARKAAKFEGKVEMQAALIRRRIGAFLWRDNEIVNIEYTELLTKREHAMDDDNLIGAMKPYRDGIALALGINDNRMRVQPCGPFERGDRSGVAIRIWIDEVKQ